LPLRRLVPGVAALPRSPYPGGKASGDTGHWGRSPSAPPGEAGSGRVDQSAASLRRRRRVGLLGGRRAPLSRRLRGLHDLHLAGAICARGRRRRSPRARLLRSSSFTRTRRTSGGFLGRGFVGVVGASDFMVDVLLLFGFVDFMIFIRERILRSRQAQPLLCHLLREPDDLGHAALPLLSSFRPRPRPCRLRRHVCPRRLLRHAKVPPLAFVSCEYVALALGRELRASVPLLYLGADVLARERLPVQQSCGPTTAFELFGGRAAPLLQCLDAGR
jgi:hypothetical protein